MLNFLIEGILNLPPQVLEHWGYGIIFVSSVLESFPVLGLAIPGGVIVMAAGFLVKIGILKFWFAVLVVFLGALVGDLSAYFLGRRYGYNFLLKIGKYIFFKPIHFEKAKNVLHAHPKKTIIVGRFHALTRCIVPFAAGSAEVKSSLFLPLAVLSAFSWSIFNILIGYVFGQGFEVASKYLGAIFFAAITVSILIIYSFDFINRFTEKNKKVIQRFQIFPLFFNLASIFFLARISEAVLSEGRVHRLDLAVNEFLANFQPLWLTKFFIYITALATPTNLTLVGILLAAYFILRKHWYYLALLPSSLLAGLLSFTLLKKIIHISRPLFPLIPTAQYSFPSGHGTLAVIFFGLIIYFFKDSIKNLVWRRIFIFVSCLLATLICFSRLYLNVHWLSDVLAGMALGIFWLTFFILLFHFFTNLSPRTVESELKDELE